MASRKKRNNSPSAGGVGSARGTVYQSKAAAWWLTRVLTQNTTIGALFGLSGGAFPIRVVGQTEDPVDDMRVEFNDNSTVFLQCKRSVSLSNNLASEFGKAWRQFCQQAKNGQESKHLARCILCYEEPNPSLAKQHKRPLLIRNVARITDLLLACHHSILDKMARQRKHLSWCKQIGRAHV